MNNNLDGWKIISGKFWRPQLDGNLVVVSKDGGFRDYNIDTNSFVEYSY